jgi:hypothetical protein
MPRTHRILPFERRPNEGFRDVYILRLTPSFFIEGFNRAFSWKLGQRLLPPLHVGPKDVFVLPEFIEKAVCIEGSVFDLGHIVFRER